AEWSNRGKRANIVWFAGFVPDSHPPLAYALALESKPGEKVSGGLTAAPVVGQFLAEVFQNPDRHGIRPGAIPAPLLKEPLTPPEPPAPAPEVLPAPVLAQEGATMPESPNLTALVAVPVPSGTPAGVSSNRALSVEETTPGASPALTLTSRTSPGAPPQTVVVPRAQPLAEEDNLPPAYDQTTQAPATPATRSRQSPLTSGNGVIMNSGGARSGPTVVRTQRKADALPPPIDQAPAPAPPTVAETLHPPVTAEAIPASAPAGEPNPRDRGNKAGRSPAKVPRATAVVEDPAASVVQAPSPAPAQPQPPVRPSKTATRAPKALPVESLPADAAMIPAEAAPPLPPPEPRKRKFRLFGNDDDDDKKDEDD
ncbi:MAG: hypothetical protein ACAI34_14240, partial [Verrucomicrobium sp.]|nr:hypothetical protein [Verrucomicrobium sp.]